MVCVFCVPCGLVDMHGLELLDTFVKTMDLPLLAMGKYEPTLDGDIMHGTAHLQIINCFAKNTFFNQKTAQRYNVRDFFHRKSRNLYTSDILLQL